MATRPRGIWRTRFPPQRLAITVAGTVPDSEPAFAELCPEDGIGSARLSFTGTVFLILTMGVRNFAELRVIGGESPLNGNKPGFRASESGGMASAERAQRCEEGGAKR